LFDLFADDLFVLLHFSKHFGVVDFYSGSRHISPRRHKLATESKSRRGRARQARRG
jgi:hypothetical protein